MPIASGERPTDTASAPPAEEPPTFLFVSDGQQHLTTQRGVALRHVGAFERTTELARVRVAEDDRSRRLQFGDDRRSPPTGIVSCRAIEPALVGSPKTFDRVVDDHRNARQRLRAARFFFLKRS